MPGLDLPEVWGIKAGEGFRTGALCGPRSPVQPEQLPLVTYWFAARQPMSRRAWCHSEALRTPRVFLPPPTSASAKGTGAAKPPWGCAGESTHVSSTCPAALRVLVRADGPLLPLSCQADVGQKPLKEKNLFEDDLASPNGTISICEQTCLSTSRIDLFVHIITHINGAAPASGGFSFDCSSTTEISPK